MNVENQDVVNKLIELINTKLKTLVDIYSSYRTSLKSYEENPSFFLDTKITERTSVFAREINASMNEINMLLVVLSNQEYMHIESITDLIDFPKTKKIRVCFIQETTIENEWRAIPHYGVYNATIGKIDYGEEQLKE